MQFVEGFIDANLLVLLVVGAMGRDAIGKHKRTRRFTLKQYDRLCEIVLSLDRILVTPNTLTEASNLLQSRADTRPMSILRDLIRKAREITVESRIAADNDAFPRLGLTDVVLLESISAEKPLITVDFELYSAAASEEGNAAINLVHIAKQ